MTQQIPVIDLEAAVGGRPLAGVLDAVRAAAEQIGIVQVVNHGIDADLIDEFSRRTGELLALPRAEKAKLASPHPYRGWRQWPDDFGRLELERYNVAQFDTPQDAKAAGVREEYLGLFAHQNVWPDAQLREVAFSYMDASRRLAERMLGLYAQAEDRQRLPDLVLPGRRGRPERHGRYGGSGRGDPGRRQAAAPRAR